jgi:hypothetical protein
MQTFNMTNSDFTANPGNAADPIERLMWHCESAAAEAVSSAADGIPVLPVIADMVDARGWDPEAMRRKVSEFPKFRVLPTR